MGHAEASHNFESGKEGNEVGDQRGRHVEGEIISQKDCGERRMLNLNPAMPILGVDSEGPEHRAVCEDQRQVKYLSHDFFSTKQVHFEEL